jgi:hypothetical protein
MSFNRLNISDTLSTEGPASSERVETRLDEGLEQPGLRSISEELTREGEVKKLRRH